MTTPTDELAFAWNGLTLTGTLSAPSGAGPHPAMLMLQGSGPADRECGGYFPSIRRAFLDRQVVTFAFDKPGCGESSGDWREHGFEGRVSQAVAALELLREHPAVDAGRVGVWGQSQGGWLVQLLASRRSDLRVAIANSGPSIGVCEQNLYACEHTMRSRGHTDAAIEQVLALVDSVHAAARRGDDFETVDAEILQPVADLPWYGDDFTIDSVEEWQFLRLLVDEEYEPRDALARITTPFLAVYGGLDVLVPPWRGAEESGRALLQAGNDDATVVVFPAGDHRIQDPRTGRFVTGYLDLLGDWTARRMHGISD